MPFNGDFFVVVGHFMLYKRQINSMIAEHTSTFCMVMSVWSNGVSQIEMSEVKHVFNEIFCILPYGRITNKHDIFIFQTLGVR
jgi:hypothetical protein